MNDAINERRVALDAAMATGKMDYPFTIGERVYVCTPTYACRGVIRDVGPLGIMLGDAERVFDSGELGPFLAGGAPLYAEPLGDRHFVSWFYAGEITLCAASAEESNQT